jgi:hypothetical protein
MNAIRESVDEYLEYHRAASRLLGLPTGSAREYGARRMKQPPGGPQAKTNRIGEVS